MYQKLYVHLAFNWDCLGLLSSLAPDKSWNLCWKPLTVLIREILGSESIWGAWDVLCRRPLQDCVLVLIL